MKNLFLVSSGGRFFARLTEVALVFLTACAVGLAFLPVAQAQNPSPVQMIQSELPQGKTMQTAGKAEFLAAAMTASQKFPSAAPQIARAAAGAHPEWKKDILRSIFQGLGMDDCRLLGRVLRALATGPDANELTELALELAPNCAPAFGGGEPGGGGGGFGAPPANLNPPPGSIGGGGGQGNVVAVCVNGITQFVSPQGAEQVLNSNPGATLGACVVTPVTNR